MRPRLDLIHRPTPLVVPARLSELLGVDLSIKRDDATGGAEAGNKVRKLEWFLADALATKSTVVITCGGTQSNHARSTAILCASLGLRSILFLRRGDLKDEDATGGNVLLDRLVGAEIRWIDAAAYADRTSVLANAARELAESGERPYVIPEGGSNGLGSLGYVDAMREVKAQLDASSAPRFDVVAHACGSGGTAAGIVLGARQHDVAKQVWSFAVCNDRAYFEAAIARIAAEAKALDPDLGAPADLVVDDRARGPRYGIMSEEQRAFLVLVARTSGVVLDPVYTGKALFGVVRAVERGEIAKGARVLFVHTGGLPGLLAQSATFEKDFA
ncbi:MAG: putative pyridoxal phosphate-dependent deaminase [Myxococcaceae bacterium]|nr:putative pyridoxal phosphate-dependent deaminase [Myxococcaceae bacterium]